MEIVVRNATLPIRFEGVVLYSSKNEDWANTYTVLVATNRESGIEQYMFRTRKPLQARTAVGVVGEYIPSKDKVQQLLNCKVTFL